jgi:hypothetical protein
MRDCPVCHIRIARHSEELAQFCYRIFLQAKWAKDIPASVSWREAAGSVSEEQRQVTSISETLTPRTGRESSYLRRERRPRKGLDV